MRRFVHSTLAAAAALVSLGSVRCAFGQYNIISQTRSLTITAPDPFSPGVDDITTQQPSDTDTAAGFYSNSITGGINGVFQVTPNPTPTSPGGVTSTASQTSTVSSSLFSVMTQISNFGVSPPFSPMLNATGDSEYSVTFTVSSPTPIVISESDTLSPTAEPQGAGEDTYLAKLTLTSGSFQLASFGYNVSEGDGPFALNRTDIPAPFGAELTPGNTYTLTMDLNVFTPISPDEEFNKTDVASLSFTASVPEPASLGLLAGAALLGLRRRR